MAVDRRKSAAVAHLKGTKHRIYEDSFRMLPRVVPLVESLNRGKIFAVFDGIGSAPEGRHAGQFMADHSCCGIGDRDNLLISRDLLYRYG